MLADSAYVEELRRLIRRTPVLDVEPTGRDQVWRIEDLRVVSSPDGFDDLEVVRAQWLGRGRAWQRSRGHLLFDRQWRVDAGFEEPAAFLPVLLRDALDCRDRAARLAEPAPGPTPHPDEIAAAWDALLSALGGLGRLERGPSGLEVTVDGQVLFVHLEPEEWARHAVPRDAARASWDEPCAQELVWTAEAALARGEHHVVMFRGRPCRSTRTALPPVPGRLAGGEWFAYRPLAD